MTRTTSDVVVIVAPAGYGKTRFALRLTEMHSCAAWCDCADGSLESVARNVLDALCSESDRNAFAVSEDRALAAAIGESDAVNVARRAWARTQHEPSTFVFDNVEGIVHESKCTEFIASLIMSRPSGRRVVFASRVDLPRKLSRLLTPDFADFISASHLRIAEKDALEMLTSAGAPRQDAERGVRFAEGWPMALAILSRFAAKGRLGEELSSTYGAVSESLISYLAREYVAQMEPAAFDATLLAATLPNPTLCEIADLSGIERRRFDAFLERSPFVKLQPVDVLAVHPVVVSLVSERYRSDRSVMLERGIARASRMGDWLRAAEIAAFSGDVVAASRFLAAFGAEITPALVPRLVGLLSRLPRDAVLDQPEVWVHTLEIRRFGIPMDELVIEARRVLSLVSPRTTPALYFDVVRLNVSVLMHAGKVTDAAGVIAEAHHRLQDSDVRHRLAVISAALASTSGKYVAAREQYLRESADHPELMARYLDLIDATMALRSGRYDLGVAKLEESVRVQRRNCWIAPLLVTLSNLAYEAWAVGDEERFASSVAELKANLLAGHEMAWKFWLAAASGQEIEETGYEPVTIRAVAYQFLACSNSGEGRLRQARLASKLADQSNDIGLRIHASIVLCEHDREHRSEIKRKLLEMADELDLHSFRDAVRAYVGGATELGALARFVERRVRSNVETSPTVDIFLSRGAVQQGEVPVAVTVVESALLQFLALYQRAVSRQVICDALWPDADDEAAINNLKVVVHRVRKKLGASAVTLVANGYCLGPNVRVDIVENERRVRHAESAASISASEIAELLRIAEATCDHRRDQLLKYDWYASVDRRLSALRHDALLIAARASRAAGKTFQARSICRMLLDDDDSDEDAIELERVLVLAQHNEYRPAGV